jgi:hypothetical protein
MEPEPDVAGKIIVYQLLQQQTRIDLWTNRMHIKSYLLLVLATSAAPGFALNKNEMPEETPYECQAVAKELNKSKKISISMDGMQALATWRAACAERPPTGAGNVTALCEGKLNGVKGAGRVFFWEKSHQGKAHRGYFTCTN